jgi:hypothetical protein
MERLKLAAEHVLKYWMANTMTTLRIALLSW